MTRDTDDPAHASRELASHVLMRMAATISAGLASFSSWLIVGCAAILGVIVANLDTVTAFIPAKTISKAIVFFLVALALNVIQRYLAGMVIASAELTKELRDTPWNRPVDTDVFFSEMERAIHWPMRNFLRYLNRRFTAGDITASARLHATLAQVQGWLVLLEMVFVIVSVGVLAAALAT